MSRALLSLIGLALCGAACSNSPTEPTSTGATPSIEQYTASLDVLGSVPYTFSLAQTTNVRVTLASLTDAAGDASRAVLGMALGTTTDGTTCEPTTSVNTAPSLNAQIVTTLNPGNYCVSVSDVGNLSGASTFVVRIIQHPPIASGTTATVTETFASNIARGGLASKTFYAAEPGVVALTLQSLTPVSVVGLALGVPGLDGTGCNVNTVVKVGPSSSPHLTLPVDTAPYCVRIFDAGGLTTGVNGLASFSITIVHP